MDVIFGIMAIIRPSKKLTYLNRVPKHDIFASTGVETTILHWQEEYEIRAFFEGRLNVGNCGNPVADFVATIPP